MNVCMTSNDKGITDVPEPTQRSGCPAELIHLPTRNSPQPCDCSQAAMTPVKRHIAHPGWTRAISFPICSPIEESE